MADRAKGQIRVGFYDIERTIGKGNFAVVKLAKHRITKTEVCAVSLKKVKLLSVVLSPGVCVIEQCGQVLVEITLTRWQPSILRLDGYKEEKRIEGR